MQRPGGCVTIENNSLFNNPNGIQVDGNTNIVFRNIVCGSANLYIIGGAGNLVGPVNNNLAAAGPWDNIQP